MIARIAGSAASVIVLNGGLHRGQQPPQVDHDRREREVLVVGVPERRRREPVDPQDELVEIAAQALRREEDGTEHDGQEQPDAEYGEVRPSAK